MYTCKNKNHVHKHAIKRTHSMSFKFQYPSTFECQGDHVISHLIYNSSFNCLMTSYISFIGQLSNAYMHKVPQSPCGLDIHLMFIDIMPMYQLPYRNPRFLKPRQPQIPNNVVS